MDVKRVTVASPYAVCVAERGSTLQRMDARIKQHTLSSVCNTCVCDMERSIGEMN
jgi:hypothetical protein